MRTRFRLFAALLALLALTTSVVEQAWGAACMEVEESSPATVLAQDTGSPSSADVSGDHDPLAPGEQRSHAPTDPGSCPMAAVSSGISCGAAALPVTTLSVPLGTEVDVMVTPATDEAPGSLTLSSLFRPPRG